MFIRSAAVEEPIRKHRFTVKDYHLMGEAGVLTHSDRVELLDGEIHTMTPIGSRHQYCVNRLVAVLSKLGTQGAIQAQGPIIVDDYSEPEPDLSLLVSPLERYLDQHPGPEDVHLVVEVAATTLAFDRGRKLRAYARNGIRDYWIVNLEAGTIEVYREPAGAVYGSKQTFGPGESLSPLSFPEFEIPADDILPPSS